MNPKKQKTFEELEEELKQAEETLNELLDDEVDVESLNDYILYVRRLLNDIKEAYKRKVEEEMEDGATIRLRDIPKYTTVNEVMKLTKKQRIELYKACKQGRSCYLVDEGCFYDSFFDENGEY